MDMDIQKPDKQIFMNTKKFDVITVEDYAVVVGDKGQIGDICYN